jgi:hypothetical protein
VTPAEILAFFEHAVEIALAFVPVEELKASLDSVAKSRADRIADVAEDLKVGPKP